MSYFVIAFIIVMIIYVIYKNIVILKRYKNNKVYINLYSDVLNNGDTAKQKVDEFLANNNYSLEYKTKVYILKLYYELNNKLDCEDTRNNLELKNIYYYKDKFSYNMLSLNCDSIIFLIMDAVKAYAMKKKAIIYDLIDRVKTIGFPEDSLEYLEFIAFCNALLNKDDKGIPFSKMLLEGTYTNLRYEKNMIGLYKRIAACILAYNECLDDEYYLKDLSDFACTLIGRNIMIDMKLYDKYVNNKDE